MITRDQLTAALAAAGESHHEYEENYLSGVRDEQWPGYYAAFTLGRLPDLPLTPTQLTRVLEGVDAEDWIDAAADATLHEISATE